MAIKIRVQVEKIVEYIMYVAIYGMYCKFGL
jgi:hypothetical protein